MNETTIKTACFASIIFAALFILACDKPLVRNDLEAIKARGELVLITRNNFACYYEASHGHAGFEYELARAFADHLGVRLRPLIIEDEADMVEALLQGKADIIAAGFPFGSPSTRLLAFGPGYLPVREQVVGRRGGPEVTSEKDLSQMPIWLSGNSGSLEQLRKLKTNHPALTWHTLAEYSSEEMLHMVWTNAIPFTIVESTAFIMNRRFYPELVVQMDLGDSRQLRWAMNPQSRQLHREVAKWFANRSAQDVVANLSSHYYSHLEDFDYVDIARYRRRIFNRLPKYKEHFQEAARQFGLDWQLVAAQAYQESHWNPRAKSFTGVRGIMMLTQETAKLVGLKNRLAEKEGIYAGTKYLARLHGMLNQTIPEPDRTLMALAAYNLGPGHLQDARELARRLGKSPNAWGSVREVLPLLQQKKYYKTVKHGYARGKEAVQYVDRIRTYHKVLHMAFSPTSFVRLGANS